MVQQVEELIGDAVYDPSGDKIGKVKRVYVDNSSGQPTWAAVSTGLFSDDSLVPLAGAQLRGNNDELQVRVRKDAVKSAPHLERDGLITQESEQELFVHYGIDPGRAGWADYGQRVPDSGKAGMAPQGQQTPRMGQTDDTSAMVRSEEQLDIGTQQRTTGQARLRKYVVTEEQTVHVPTTHEEAYIEREPITDRTGTKAEMGEDERAVTLHEDRVTVHKEQVPVEKVRLGVEEVPDDQTVTETVRKERIDTEGVDDDYGKHSTGRDNPGRDKF